MYCEQPCRNTNDTVNIYIYSLYITLFVQLDDINLGTLSHIVIGHDDSGIGAGWFLDDVRYIYIYI